MFVLRLRKNTMGTINLITLFTCILFVAKNVESEGIYLQRLSPNMQEKMKDLFQADKEFCQSFLESVELGKTLQLSREILESTRKNIQNEEVALNTKASDLTTIKEFTQVPNDLAIFVLEERYAEAKVSSSANIDMFKTIEDVYLNSIKDDTDKYEKTLMKVGYLTRVRENALSPVLTTWTNELRQKDARLYYKPKDRLPLRSSRTSILLEYKVLLLNMVQFRSRVLDVYQQRIALAEKMFLTGLQQHKDYAEVSKSILMPRILFQEPVATINNQDPWLDQDCDSPYRQDELMSAVILLVLKQNQQELASNGPVVSEAFPDWFEEDIMSIIGDMVSHPASAFKTRATTMPSLILKLEKDAEEFESKRDEMLNRVWDAEEEEVLGAPSPADVEEDLQNELFYIMSILRNMDQCMQDPLNVERLLSYDPLREWRIEGSNNENV